MVIKYVVQYAFKGNQTPFQEKFVIDIQTNLLAIKVHISEFEYLINVKPNLI